MRYAMSNVGPTARWALSTSWPPSAVALGIDYHKQNVAANSRPIHIVDRPAPAIAQLFCLSELVRIFWLFWLSHLAFLRTVGENTDPGHLFRGIHQ
jgi:hypothetical protein